MNTTFFRSRKICLHAALAGALGIAGCKTPPLGLRERQVAKVLEMNRAGELNAEQTVKVLALVHGRDLGTSSIQSVQKKSQTLVQHTTQADVTPFPAATPRKRAGDYTPKALLRGRLRSVGSDTMDKVMGLWEKGFREYHPSVRFFHEGKGSSTAPPALMEGQADFGPMSRSLKAQERERFKQRFGYEPLVFRVAVDSIAIYVHPSNPLVQQGLDFTQLDSVFSETRKRGGPDITTWGQLGLTGVWSRAPIHVYSRNSASGTYGYFRKHVLSEGDYRSTNKEVIGSEALVEAISLDPLGIGYSGIGYRTETVGVIPLSTEPGGQKFPPEAEYAYSEQYPLARFLYLTINHRPSSKASDLHREFLAYVYSQEGQSAVEMEGFFPVSKTIATEDLSQLGR